METERPSLKARLSAFFLRDKIPFTTKADVNWKRVRNCLAAGLAIGILVVLLLPTPKQEESTFHEKLESGSSSAPPETPAQDPNAEAAQLMTAGATTSPGHFERSPGGGGPDKSAPMILTRGGSDSKTQSPPGTRIAVHLREMATVSSQGVPIIGVVARDYVQDDTVAVPAGSRLIGQASLDGDDDRARIEWQSIELPDGKSRTFAAIGVSQDGQLGVEGRAHSDTGENIVGATLSRFVGAYAEGAMERGSFGGNPGGSSNGWKNAIAETAKDRADGFAEDLKKEKRWIELGPETEFFAVLTSPFTFRDPGATVGR
jgi:hypothetical protein